MKPSNGEGVPRLLRWIINDVSNTIEKDLNDAMKKMKPGWVKTYTDEERLLLDEYRRQKQENNINAVKEKLRISDMRRTELDEELTEVLDRKERLLSFIEEKRLQVNEVGLMSLTEREVNDFRNYTLDEIFKCAKEIRLETEEDGEIEEEEDEEDGEKHKEDDEIEEDEDEEEEEDDKVEEEHKKDDDDGDDNDKEEHNEDGDMHDHNDDDNDDDGDDNDKEGSKDGDMHDHDNEKEGSKGGDDEHGTESERNEVPSETLENQSTPSPKTNEANEEGDGKDGTSQGVEYETGNKPSTSMPKKSVINEDKQDQVNLDDQNVMDGTRTAEIDEATIIAAEAIYVRERIIEEAVQFIKQNPSEFFSSQEVEEEKTTPVRTREGRMKEAEMLKTQDAGKLSKTPQKRNSKRKLDPEFTAEGKTKRVVIKSDPKGKGIKEGQEPGYPAPIKRKGDVYRPHNPLPDVRLSPLYHAMQPG
ncbi:glutamic acid-rich protein-like [Papaver somniferum]|uniref:glutamic acid-rich protein-like n=1 Tax=Papaver somniferum TaxID=3469 RepID=UPI000E701510|nr:glutamic acid-rich protein-like [Papaver somniferum]